MILCIDAKRTVDAGALPIDARIIRFDKYVPVDEVVKIIDRALVPSQPVNWSSVGRSG